MKSEVKRKKFNQLHIPHGYLSDVLYDLDLAESCRSTSVVFNVEQVRNPYIT